MDKLKIKRKHRGKREKGQAMVEFALVLPIFLIIVCGIIDFGWLFFNQLSLNNNCREGARWIIVNSTQSDTEQESHIRTGLSDIFDADEVDIDIDFSASNRTEGDVTVKLKTNMHVMTPVMMLIVGGDEREIVSEVVMKVEF